MATWLLRPPATSSKRRRSSAVMAMNAGSREPQSLSMARRVSSCVVNGPGVNSSGDSGMATSLPGRTGVATPAGEPPQAPAGERHHAGDAKTGRHEEGRAPTQPDDRRQEKQQVVGVKAECPRIGLGAWLFQSLERLRPVAAGIKCNAGPQTQRDGGPA